MGLMIGLYVEKFLSIKLAEKKITYICDRTCR